MALRFNLYFYATESSNTQIFGQGSSLAFEEVKNTKLKILN
jgi:hypothetical protein